MDQQTRRFPLRVDDTVAVWEEFKEVTNKYKCLSLGEGAPAKFPPEFLVNNLREAIQEGHNQYTRVQGHPLLVQKIAEVYGKKIGRTLDPWKEIIVGVGANNLISNILLAHIKPGQEEEVAVFEPCWPCYFDHIQYAGAKTRPIPLELKGDKWTFDREVFKQQISNKTKVLIINNAQNPTGKMFTREELEFISQVLEQFPQVLVLSDDVYEFLTFDHNEFVGFATIGSNFNRTITTYSGGKLFNATGWKVGWAVGPENLLKPVGVITNVVVYCANTPI